MKIIQVVHSFFPIRGGHVNHVYYISKFLMKKGHEVKIFTSGNSIQPKNEEMDGIPVRRLPSFNVPLSRCPDYVPYTIIPTLTLELINERADVIHVHGYEAYTVFAAALASRFSKKPLVMTIHGLGVLYGKNILKFLLKLYDKSIGRFVLKTAEKIVVVSKSQIEEIRGRGGIIDPRKVIEIPNGVDLNFYTNLPDGREFKKEFSLKDKTILFTAGRIIKIKGFQHLIKVGPELEEEIGNIRIVIAGADGGYKKELIKLAKDSDAFEKVVFTGLLSESMMREALAVARVVVIPSIYEGFSILTLEAMACGKAIIASNVGGISNIIENNKDGILIPPGNEDELLRAISRVLRDDNLAKSLGRNAREKAPSYDWRVIVDKLINIYEEVIS